jgi:CO/xanthine dehydrogenase Mo-binding subunit
VVIELELAGDRHAGVPLETRGAIAVPDTASGILRFHGAAKVPHYNRQALALMLGLPPTLIHLHGCHVGGGFGIRGELYPEDVLVCAAALRLKRPIKSIEDRYEHLIAANQSRGQLHRVRTAVDERGLILGLDDEFWFDQGAYLLTHGVTVPDLTAAMLPGPYTIPAYRSIGRVRLTNKTPCGTYRAPGRFEGSFVRERLLDAIATRLGLDPVGVRRANLIPKSAMSFRRGFAMLGTDVAYDTEDYRGFLDKCLLRFDWRGLRSEAARRRRAGRLGAGLLCRKERPRAVRRRAHCSRQRGNDRDRYWRRVARPSGSRRQWRRSAPTGSASGLTASASSMARTDRIARGMGAFASRVTVMTGAAMALAADRLRGMLLEAGQLLQTSPDELRIAEDCVIRRDRRGGPSADFASIADAAGGEIAAEATFTTEHMTYPYGVHIAQVRVRRDSCAILVERFFVGFEIGRAVNPMLAEGQIAGGVAQGIGASLLEEFAYDASGQPLSVTLADYLMPTVTEIPPIEIMLFDDEPTPLNPLGVKGAGEAGIAGVGAAIAAAVGLRLTRESRSLSVAETVHQRFLLTAIDFDDRAVDEMREICRGCAQCSSFRNAMTAPRADPPLLTSMSIRPSKA